MDQSTDLAIDAGWCGVMSGLRAVGEVLGTAVATALQRRPTSVDRIDVCKTCACAVLCWWLQMQILVSHYQICGVSSLLKRTSGIQHCYLSHTGACESALVQCQDF